LRQAARRCGVHAPNIVLLEGTYAGKNLQFASLASKASRGEFLIADSVPDSFLAVFLEQARGWRAIGNRNTLRFDDAANVVSFSCDPALERFAPMPAAGAFGFESEFEEAWEMPARSRYLAL